MVTFDYKKTPITQIADYIIMYAAKSGASDIHFDPKENGLMVRIRIDGDLQDYTLIPPDYERNLTTRLKLLANMNITESRLPQDGAIKRQFGKLYLDMRASSLPTNEGEKIVIRILDYSRSLQGLEHLGFSHTNFEKLKRMIQVPNGIILVTGATGTGKSTTTYSILQALNKPETNIITVEDPIEMNIEGMNQVQVNSEIGLDFATVLRSILRQDPNIILIGEIRDSETAKIAVRASITGHLVLSTIHTNNSLSTIERLLDMDVERYLLSSALTGIISQRLAKMLCPKCKIEREATPYEKKIFKKVLKEDIEKLYDANHDGCDYCHNGYKGRIAVQEVLEIDDEIRDALNNEKLEKEDLREMVYTSNVITLLQDGLEKVLEGITSFDEIYRIIEIDSDITEDYGAELTEANKERLKQEKQNKVKEETNSEVTDSAKAINSDDKTTAVDEAATASANSQNVESIINKIDKKEEKSDIIITPPMIPAYTENDDYNNDANVEQSSNINSTTIDIPSVQNNQNEIKNEDSNDSSFLSNVNGTNNDTNENALYNTNSLAVPSVPETNYTNENMNNENISESNDEPNSDSTISDGTNDIETPSVPESNSTDENVNNDNVSENNDEPNSDSTIFYGTNNVEVPSVPVSNSTDENMNNDNVSESNSEPNSDSTIFYGTNDIEAPSVPESNSTDENINDDNNHGDEINFSPLSSNENTISEPTLSLLTELPQNYNQMDSSDQVNLQPTISTINDATTPTLIEGQTESEPTLIENN